MKTQRLVAILLFANVGLLIALIAEHTPTLSAAQAELPVLRGRALEIVDEAGFVRASIKVHGPTTVNGRQYPGAVVLVMGDPRGAPGVKLGASETGAGLSLASGRLPDGRSVGIQLHADDTRLLLIDLHGQERTLKP